MDGDKQYRIGKNKNGCEALVGSLKFHLHSAKVVLEGLRLGVNLVFPQLRPPYGIDGWAHIMNQLAVESQAVEAVMTAMEKHEQSIYVQEAGCLFVWTFLVKVVNETHVSYGLDYVGCPAGGEIKVNLALAGKGETASSRRVNNSQRQLLSAEGLNGLSRPCITLGTRRNTRIQGEQGCAALFFLSTLPGKLRNLIIEKGAVQIAKRVLEAQKEIAPARTWAARLLQQLTGEDFSQHIMKIDVPGPRMDDDFLEDLTKEDPSCTRYCGCRGPWDELAPFPGDLAQNESTSSDSNEEIEAETLGDTLANNEGKEDPKSKTRFQMTSEEKKEIARWKQIADVSDSMEATNAKLDWESSQRQAKYKVQRARRESKSRVQKVAREKEEKQEK
eukprot:763601-Hanusia_phi.AAC.8